MKFDERKEELANLATAYEAKFKRILTLDPLENDVFASFGFTRTDEGIGILEPLIYKIIARVPCKKDPLAQAADVYEKQAAMLEQAHREMVGETEGEILVWNIKPLFAFDTDVESRKIIIGLLAHFFVKW
jgi:hypothetical protein